LDGFATVGVVYGIWDEGAGESPGVEPMLRRLELERYEEIEPIELDNVLTERMEAFRSSPARDGGGGDVASLRKLIAESRRLFEQGTGEAAVEDAMLDI
jgi:hypothetical protein